jgi:hypothetical protein
MDAVQVHTAHWIHERHQQLSGKIAMFFFCVGWVSYRVNWGCVLDERTVQMNGGTHQMASMDP